MINRTQAARKLEVTFVQDDRDELVPSVEIDCGYTVTGTDEDDEVVFVGNIYKLECDRGKSQVKFTAYDNCFILNRSKTYKKIKDSAAEDVAAQICSEMGIIPGEFASTGVKINFIANDKTGYQIIMDAYFEVSKQNDKVYQLVMDGDRLNVIEKGELCGAELDSTQNMTGSIYRESIENVINQVLVVDEAGNGTGEVVTDSESIGKYSMIQATLKEDKEKDSQAEANGLFKKSEREGLITALGDYRCKAGYSLVIRDSLLAAKMMIISDNHTFHSGQHIMKLTLEFISMESD